MADTQPTTSNVFTIKKDFVIYGTEAYMLSDIKNLSIQRKSGKFLLVVQFSRANYNHEFDDESHAYNMREYYMKTEEGAVVNLPANLQVKEYLSDSFTTTRQLLFTR